MSKVCGALDPLFSFWTLHTASFSVRLLLFLGLATLPGPVAADAAQTSTAQLATGFTETIHLAVGEARKFKVTLLPQEAVRLTLTQGEHFQKMVLQGPQITGSTRTNDSGSGASIFSTLVNTSPTGAPAIEYDLTIQSYHSNEESDGSLDLEPAPFPLAEAEQRVKAEDLFYDAEYLRRTSNEKSWPRANEEFQRSLALIQPLNDPYLELAILTEQSRLLLFRLNDYVSAQQTAAQAAEIAGLLNQQTSSGLYSNRSLLTLKALCLKTLGSTDYYLSDYPSAILHSNQALAIYRQLNDLYWEGILRGNLAYVYFESGDTSRALETATRALAIAEQVYDEYGRVYTLEALGSIHLARGEFDDAYDSYQQALTLTQKTPYPAIEALIWRGLGRFYQDVSKNDLAEQAYQQAIASAKKASDNAAFLEATSELAALELAQGKLKQAHTVYESGLALSLNLKLSRETVLLQSGLALTLNAEKSPRLGIQQAQQAEAVAHAIGFVEGQAIATKALAELHLNLNDLPAAREDYSRAAQLFESIQDRVQTAHSLAQLARIDSTSDLHLAQTEANRALELIESTRVLVPGRELRTSYFADQQSVYALNIELMLRLNRASPSQTYVKRAFEIAEMARARSMLDQTGLYSQAASASSNNTQQTASCQLQLAAAYQRLHDLNFSDENANYRIARTQNEVTSQLAVCDSLADLGRSTRSQRLTDLATIDTVQRALTTQHASLIEYWLGDTESCLWYITPHGVRLVILPPRQRIEAQVKNIGEFLIARQARVQGEDLAGRASRIQHSDQYAADLLVRLGKLLITPVPPHTTNLLYIVPDGTLASLPFSALVPQSGQAPLLMQHEIAEEPSSSVLLHLLAIQSEARPTDNRIAVFADPIYSTSDDRMPQRQPNLVPASAHTSFGLPELARLPASSTEAASITALAPNSGVETHLGFDASTRAILATDWSRYRVLHLALHALIGRTPAFTGIAFSMYSKSGRSQDGMLWLNQIDRLKGSPRLVFLSACSTAGGKDVPGEGIDSLANAFLSHGSHSVIGSLWSVDDQASSRLVREFYDNLLTLHLSPSAALRRAQLSFANSPHYNSPLYWAAFQLEGLAGN